MPAGPPVEGPKGEKLPDTLSSLQQLEQLSHLQQSPVPFQFPLPDVVIATDAMPTHCAFYPYSILQVEDLARVSTLARHYFPPYITTVDQHQDSVQCAVLGLSE